MENLFAYGTLMCSEIMKSVTGLQLPGEQGVLQNYRRLQVKGEQYPGLVPQAGESVAGMVYRNVPSVGWQRLDHFEGEMYLRQKVEVELQSNVRVEAWAYLVKPVFRHRLSEDKWHFEEFLARGKKVFMQSYRGYDTLKEEP